MSYEFTAQSRDAVIHEAKRILKERVNRQICMTGPAQVKVTVREFVQVTLASKRCEVFFVLYLNNQHRLITSEEVFTGTIDGCTVYPREVARRALEHNAAAVILAHNHPSGECRPSEADKHITKRLQDALELLDIRVLDHLIVGGDRVLSFAEECLL